MPDTCICCGEIIPEGRMVCPDCEAAVGRERKKEAMTLLDTRDWKALETAMHRHEPLAIIHDFPGQGITVTASVEKAPESWGCEMIVGILVDGPGWSRRQRQYFRNIALAQSAVREWRA